MAYSDLNLIHNPATGTIPPASWGDQVRDNLEFLIDPPACSVYGSAAQSIADSTTTVLLANSENFDNASMHSTSSNTGRITGTTAGRFLVFSTVQFDANATGVRNLSFLVNGTTTVQCMQVLSGTAVSSIVLTATRALTLAAGDYVECRGRQTSGGSLGVTLLEFGVTYLTR